MKNIIKKKHNESDQILKKNAYLFQKAEDRVGRRASVTMASGKKLLNSVASCVDDNLAGYVAMNPGVNLLKVTFTTFIYIDNKLASLTTSLHSYT